MLEALSVSFWIFVAFAPKTLDDAQRSGKYAAMIFLALLISNWLRSTLTHRLHVAKAQGANRDTHQDERRRQAKASFQAN